MINLFKKVKKVVQEGRYSADIEQIHHEFDIAGETLLKEALLVLEECKDKDIHKGELLNNLGFTQTPQAKAVSEIKEKKKIAEKTARIIEDLSIRYPNNKFITEEMVGQICKKYNLVCGNVSLYKGFVPQKNLEQIEKFRLKEEDKVVEGFCWGIGFDKARAMISRSKFIEADSAISQNFRWAFSRELDLPGTYFDEVKEATIKICAPIKDMDTKGMKLTGYHLDKIIPDPVVLQPIDGGYLIITAWGDEASDPLVVNERNN